MPLLDSLLPNYSADVVAIFDDGFNQVLLSARPIKATVRKSAKVMEHPIETGSTITDHRVIEAIDIELSLILNTAEYRSVYSQIDQLFQDGTLLTIQTKAATYDQMLISEMPHVEEPELFDVLAVAIKCKQAQFVTAQFGTLPASKVANKTQASTVDKGEAQTTDPSSGEGSYLGSISKGLF